MTSSLTSISPANTSHLDSNSYTQLLISFALSNRHLGFNFLKLDACDTTSSNVLLPESSPFSPKALHMEICRNMHSLKFCVTHLNSFMITFFYSGRQLPCVTLVMQELLPLPLRDFRIPWLLFLPLASGHVCVLITMAQGTGETGPPQPTRTPSPHWPTHFFPHKFLVPAEAGLGCLCPRFYFMSHWVIMSYFPI